MLPARDASLAVTEPSQAWESEAKQVAEAFVASKWGLPSGAPPSFQKAYVAANRRAAAPWRSRGLVVLGLCERKVLNLRFNALKRGLVVNKAVDAAFVAKISTPFCPVSLVAFDNSDVRRRASVDRLLNEGTYAPGNICALLPRVNLAKGDLTFAQVLGLATAGQAARGLQAAEWMRLCSLMSGAWVASGGRDPGLMPLATYPAPAVFTSHSHLVQHLLLEATLRERTEPPAWLLMGDSQDWARLATLWKLLGDEVQEEAYPPSAWLRGHTFDAFVSWYVPVEDLLRSAMRRARAVYQTGVDKDGLVTAWNLGVRQEKEKG